MKVFVSSTCHDLVDLRAELYEDLRELGVESLFSDLKESDFVVSTEPGVNSIEACLVNLRQSDVVIVILSQRYGPKLGDAFGNFSATHCEYIEARRAEKPIHFYVRDRLDADFFTWRRNGNRSDFIGAWCSSDGVKGLFAMIDAHRQLVGPDGTASSNNWYSSFVSSVDLRADIRRRLSPAAVRATGEKLIRQGQVPILMIAGQGVSRVGGGHEPSFERLTLNLVNAGPVPAIGVQGDLIYGGALIAGGNDSRVSSIVPYNDATSTKISFDVPQATIRQLFGTPDQGDSEVVSFTVRFGYDMPSGHTMQDNLRLNLIRRGGQIQFYRVPDYGGKTIVGMRNFLLPVDASLAKRIST
jgi:hypothetical protein